VFEILIAEALKRIADRQACFGGPEASNSLTPSSLKAHSRLE
jgi:hypothetical protein